MDAENRPTILVGVSGSPASAAALRWAEDEAERRHGRLRIVLIWHPEQRAFYAHPARRAETDGGPERARQDLAETVRAVLGAGPPGDATTEVVEGTAERTLVAESAEADLLVLGSGSGVSIGPVVRTCLRQAHCPVVVVSPQARRAATATEEAHDDPSGHATGRDAAPPRRGLLRLAERPGRPQ